MQFTIESRQLTSSTESRHTTIEAANPDDAISEFVRREVIAHLGLAPERVTAVHNGVGADYFDVSTADIAHARAELGLPPRYLLFVGTIEPRKNVLALLQAYCSLPTAAREQCPLVLAGGWGWKSERVAESG